MYTRDTEFFKALLTHKKIGEEAPYDFTDKAINASIQFLKEKRINAKITNAVMNINGKIVPLQIYVQRLNGFVPPNKADADLAADPTAYKVQVRSLSALKQNVMGRRCYFP